MKLTPAEAAALYRDKRMSACEIAQMYKLTRQGVEARIRAGGLSGVTWCPIHKIHEDLQYGNAEAVALMWARWGAK